MTYKQLVNKYRQELLRRPDFIPFVLEQVNKEPNLNFSIVHLIKPVLEANMSNEFTAKILGNLVVYLASEIMAVEKAVREEEKIKIALEKTTEQFLNKFKQEETEETKKKMSIENFKQSVMLIAENYAQSQSEKELLNTILSRIK